MQYIENRTFDEIAVGDSATLQRTLQQQDIELFALMSGDVNPAHLDKEYASSNVFHEVIAHGMWGGALISAVLGTELPGPGTIYLNQSLSFRKPVGLGDTVTVTVTARHKDADTRRIIFDCLCTNGDDKAVIVGEAEVLAPDVKVRRPRVVLPELHLHERGIKYRSLLASCNALPAARVAVVHPCDALSLSGAMVARDKGLIEPILIGPLSKIHAAAEAAGLSLEGVACQDVPHSHAAAQSAVEQVHAGEVQAIMKGKLHTDELMQAVVSKAHGLRTERRMSHAYVMDAPHYHKLLIISDAAINVVPDLMQKRDIIQNAIDLAHAMDIERPNVAVLSAVETITPTFASTIDASALCKMATRGQISGGNLDGPLAFDNAISSVAAQTKGIVSDVAGDADILVAPDLEAGNILAKQLIYLSGADAAGVVLGARVPIILTSRADTEMARLVSCALAVRLIHAVSSHTDL